MQEMTLAHYWMAGVMVVMGIYGGFAVYGYYYSLRRGAQSGIPKSDVE